MSPQIIVVPPPRPVTVSGSGGQGTVCSLDKAMLVWLHSDMLLLVFMVQEGRPGNTMSFVKVLAAELTAPRKQRTLIQSGDF